MIQSYLQPSLYSPLSRCGIQAKTELTIIANNSNGSPLDEFYFNHGLPWPSPERPNLSQRVDRKLPMNHRVYVFSGHFLSAHKYSVLEHEWER